LGPWKKKAEMRGPTEAFFHSPGYFKGSPNDSKSRAQAASDKLDKSISYTI